MEAQPSAHPPSSGAACIISSVVTSAPHTLRAGLQITDARRFVGWAAGGAVAAGPSDDEEDARIGTGPSSQPLLTTPETLDTRPQPSGSGRRRWAFAYLNT